MGVRAKGKATTMTHTGVKATPEETKMLFDMMNTPLIMLQCGSPLNPMKACHELALKHGLPEIEGYYGITQDGEFVTA
jgi:hypothetical protein